MSKARSKNLLNPAKNVHKTKRKGEQKKQLSPSPLALKRSVLKKNKNVLSYSSIAKSNLKTKHIL